MNLQADANTQRNKFSALKSVGDKVNFNKQQNNTIRMAEGISDYFYNPMTGQMEYVGPQRGLFNTVAGNNTTTPSNNAFKSLGLKEGDTVTIGPDGNPIINKKSEAEYGTKLLNKKYDQYFMFGGKMKGRKC